MELRTKQTTAHTDENGTFWPSVTLYMYEQDGENPGLWRSSEQKARASWERYMRPESVAARARRAEANRRYRESLARRADLGNKDPFARFD